MIDRYRLLLSEAGRIYEKHEAGRREPFNVFSVLRQETDEVNLHSRFLHALLDYRQSPDSPRENLADFLRLDFLQELSRRVSVDINDLDPDRARVKRESGNIDILIHDPRSQRAVVIENKIEAKDQPEQLRRYAEQLEEQGCKPHLLYLTLDGHLPSEDSAGSLNYACISYKNDLPPWLKRCQERAYEEPALRESVAQYLNLIRRLTNTNYSEEYMDALKKLCLQEENLALVQDLNDAMVEARISLVFKLWEELDCKLKEEIPDLYSRKSHDFEISESAIREIIFRRGKDFGLYYKLTDSATIGVAVEYGSPFIWFGVFCPKKENETEHNRFRKLEGGHGNDSWPWYQYTSTGLNLRNPTREHLQLLADNRKRDEFVEELVSEVRKLWDKVLNHWRSR